MKTLKLFLISLTALLWFQSPALGAMTFQVDFGPDGTYETKWSGNPDTTISLDIFVSGIPSPGLSSMGFFLDYDPTALEVVAEGTSVDGTNWPGPGPSNPGSVTFPEEGRISIAGYRLLSPWLLGNDIKLATVTFRVKDAIPTLLWLRDRVDPVANVEDFILHDGTVLDGDIGSGIKLADINKPGGMQLQPILMLLLMDQ